MFASSASHLLRQLTVDSRYLPFAVSRFVKVGMSAQCLSTSPAAADLTVQHDKEKCTFFIKLPEDHSQPGKHFFIIEGGGGGGGGGGWYACTFLRKYLSLKIGNKICRSVLGENNLCLEKNLSWIPKLNLKQSADWFKTETRAKLGYYMYICHLGIEFFLNKCEDSWSGRQERQDGSMWFNKFC